MTHTRTAGFIGLLALLVGVALFAWLFTIEYATPRSDVATAPYQPLSASGTIPQTGIEKAHADVDAAKAIQIQLNLHNMEINNTLGE